MRGSVSSGSVHALLFVVPVCALLALWLFFVPERSLGALEGARELHAESAWEARTNGTAAPGVALLLMMVMTEVEVFACAQLLMVPSRS